MNHLLESDCSGMQSKQTNIFVEPNFFMTPDFLDLWRAHFRQLIVSPMIPIPLNWDPLIFDSYLRPSEDILVSVSFSDMVAI